MADNRKRFEQTCRKYTLAIKLNKKSEKILQVAALITVIGKEAPEVLHNILVGIMRVIITKYSQRYRSLEIIVNQEKV